MKKRILAIVLALAMVFSLAACGEKKEEAPAGTDSQSSEYAVDPKTAKVAVICEPIGSEQFLLQVKNAVEKKAAEMGFEYTIMECPGDNAFLDNARASVAEGYNLIIGVGWKCAECISTVATESPDAAEYCIMDTLVDNENVTSVKFYMAEPCYVMGVLTANIFPEVKNFGVIGSFQTQTTYEQRYPYLLGLQTVNADATLEQNFVGSYTDPATAKELALQQMSKGIKVLSAQCATANDLAIADLANEHPGEIFTTGQEVDMSTPDNEYVYTGMLKNTGTVAEYFIDGFFNGTLEDGQQVLGLSSGAVGVVHVTTETANYRPDYVTDEAIAKAKEAAEKIMSGELVIQVPQEQ